MASIPKKTAQSGRLPPDLRRFFWDYRVGSLSWERDRHLIIARVLAVGDWTAVQWVRGRLGDNNLRNWLLERQGRGLTPRQLRFWELILHLPHRLVNAWLAAPARRIWDRRRHS